MTYVHYACGRVEDRKHNKYSRTPFSIYQIMVCDAIFSSSHFINCLKLYIIIIYIELWKVVMKECIEQWMFIISVWQSHIIQKLIIKFIFSRRRWRCYLATCCPIPGNPLCLWTISVNLSTAVWMCVPKAFLKLPAADKVQRENLVEWKSCLSYYHIFITSSRFKSQRCSSLCSQETSQQQLETWRTRSELGRWQAENCLWQAEVSAERD